jgi:hypothetical protein
MPDVEDYDYDDDDDTGDDGGDVVEVVTELNFTSAARKKSVVLCLGAGANMRLVSCLRFCKKSSFRYEIALHTVEKFPKNFLSSTNLHTFICKQGDQIGRIFAYRMIVNFGKFFEN